MMRWDDDSLKAKNMISRCFAYYIMQRTGAGKQILCGACSGNDDAKIKMIKAYA